MSHNNGHPKKKSTLKDRTPYGILPRHIVRESMLEQLLLPLSCVLQLASGLMGNQPFDEEAFIEWLHIRLLNISLKHIRDVRVNEEEREDCVRWVFGKRDDPFSCAACCEVAGYNHHDVQNLVESMLEEQKGGKNHAPKVTLKKEGPGVAGILSHAH